MYYCLKVVLVAFEECNPLCLILRLKGHSTYCPDIIIEFFHLGLGQQFIKPGLSAPTDTSQPLKSPETISDTMASGKVNSTDGVKYVFFISSKIHEPPSGAGRLQRHSMERRSLLLPCSHLLFSLSCSVAPINLEEIGRFGWGNFSLQFQFGGRREPIGVRVGNTRQYF